MTIVTRILGIGTVLGGIAAVAYFIDKWRDKRQFTEKEKEVNNAWWESSELKKQYESRGCKDFGWLNSDRVTEQIAEGKEIVYEIDKDNRIKYKLVNKSGQVLVCRSDA